MASKSSRWSLGGLFRLKSRTDPKPQDKSASQSGKYKAVGEPAAASNPYHAVSIVPGLESCAASHRFTGMRFLSRQAPKLPLPSCDAAHCTCRFKHHKDRRTGPRRRDEQGMMHGHWQGAEKRRTGGRRADDM
jgi:hypothetical protein